ncbi:hypothetical protein BZG02_16825 [Labilibaculum filiforme]|uniref:Calcineurin-like phosphoesterase domain-containing protein n=1 Tax=Labilibaculum filiforme TaxID=1940526 RepID=A0A2N3HSS5_9BACT|nr:metallophosphoesterase [Labilibaculum filiforme]PKQ61108.1 hypothetical protein BZG02_16825 [Labilibaculum filiforme]
MIDDIQFGKLMIVSDLHGNGFDFRQILKVYHALKSEGKADYLVFLGDLIHAYPGKQKDESLEIVKNLIDWKTNQKASDIICLLGNHEFVHIYHIALQRGNLEFTSWFENRIRKNRETIVRFFMDMPFMLRTKGGVLINHTGSSDRYEHCSETDFNWLKEYAHKGQFDAHIRTIQSYHPSIGSQFMDTKEGNYLWDVFMNGNERQYGEKYLDMIDDLLRFATIDREQYPMTVLVSGHVGVDYGAETIGDYKLRLCSSAGCLRDLEKKFLLIDAEKKYSNSVELLECCHDLF